MSQHDHAFTRKPPCTLHVNRPLSHGIVRMALYTARAKVTEDKPDKIRHSTNALQGESLQYQQMFLVTIHGVCLTA